MKLTQILIKREIYIINIKISYTIIILEQVGWDSKPDSCKDTIPKQLNYKFDPNTDNKKN